MDGVQELVPHRLQRSVGRQLEEVHAGGGGREAAGVCSPFVKHVACHLNAKPGLEVPEDQGRQMTDDSNGQVTTKMTDFI